MKNVLFFTFLILGFLFLVSPNAQAIFANPESIRVYVEPHPTSFIADEAMSAWTKATAGKVKFKKATKPEDVQIYVRFVKNIGKSTNSDTIGLTHHLYANGHRLELIEISEKSPNGRLYSRDARLRVMIHEFGHALGLEHSTDPKSVMYPSKGAKTILPDDVRTLKYVYGWK